MYHPPRALLRRQNIRVELTAAELYGLVRATEAKAVEAESEDRTDYADHLFVRAAELREAGQWRT